METNERQIIELIRQGEGISTEFKACRNRINRDVYETVCALSNRHGGTLLLGVTDAGEVQGKRILHIFVPESSQVHRCNGRIYDRNEDGDLDITDHTAQVAQLYQRKQATYSENKVYPWI